MPPPLAPIRNVTSTTNNVDDLAKTNGLGNSNGESKLDKRMFARTM